MSLDWKIGWPRTARFEGMSQTLTKRHLSCFKKERRECGFYLTGDFKKIWPRASFTCWDLTSHVSVQHEFLSGCKFPCQKYQQTSDQRSPLFCVSIWYWNFYFIFNCHGQLGELHPDGKLLMHFMSSLGSGLRYACALPPFSFPSFISYGCFNLNVFSFLME